MMAISTEEAIRDVKRRIEAAADGLSVPISKTTLRRLLKTIEEPRPVAVQPVTDLMKLVKRYGAALVAHDKAEMNHCGKVWPELLRAREAVEDAAKKMVLK